MDAFEKKSGEAAFKEVLNPAVYSEIQSKVEEFKNDAPNNNGGEAGAIGASESAEGTGNMETAQNARTDRQTDGGNN